MTAAGPNRASPSALEMVRTGSLALVEDLGRPGWAALGVGASGAVDRPALMLGNRLVGNAEDAAGLELTFGSSELRAHGPVHLAVTGAPCPLGVDGRQVAMYSLLRLDDGQRLTVGPPTAGVYTYLAVRGGIDVEPVLGSRSRDVLAGLGPAPVQAGDRLPLGEPTLRLPAVAFAPVEPPTDEPLVVRLLLGPRADWVATESLQALATNAFTVAADSNRIGVRLDGAPLRRRREEELPSEGMVSGAVQVPPSGQPVVFLADHPVTGGYPVVGVVDEADLPALAQSRPRHRVRLRSVPAPELG